MGIGRELGIEILPKRKLDKPKSKAGTSCRHLPLTHIRCHLDENTRKKVSIPWNDRCTGVTKKHVSEDERWTPLETQ